jgi:hypothetical protein
MGGSLRLARTAIEAHSALSAALETGAADGGWFPSPQAGEDAMSSVADNFQTTARANAMDIAIATRGFGLFAPSRAADGHW